MKKSIDKCIFTGLTATLSTDTSKRTLDYSIEIDNTIHSYSLPLNAMEWKDDSWFKENQHIIASLIYNNKLNSIENKYISIEDLKEVLMDKDYPKTPQQKLDNLFLVLFNLQTFDGAVIEMYEYFHNKKHWKRCYFKSEEEFAFYYVSLNTKGLLDKDDEYEDCYPTRCSITYDGLLYAIAIQSVGELSNLCFIAMSFKDDMKETREAIKQAVKDTGFEPILIDDTHINSDQSINDAIIAAIKKCKFCIADFGHHSNGVYFESGFALGLGKKVIYTCSTSEFEKTHFDLKPLQHIIYNTLEELTSKLVLKIEAWIK